MNLRSKSPSIRAMTSSTVSMTGTRSPSTVSNSRRPVSGSRFCCAVRPSSSRRKGSLSISRTVTVENWFVSSARSNTKSRSPARSKSIPSSIASNASLYAERASSQALSRSGPVSCSRIWRSAASLPRALF